MNNIDFSLTFGFRLDLFLLFAIFISSIHLFLV